MTACLVSAVGWTDVYHFPSDNELSWDTSDWESAWDNNDAKEDEDTKSAAKVCFGSCISGFNTI